MKITYTSSGVSLTFEVEVRDLVQIGKFSDTSALQMKKGWVIGYRVEANLYY